jgi:hypothetical protein
LVLIANFLFKVYSLFVWLVADGWCWFVLREKYCWLVVGGWFAPREKYCWLVADKPNEQGVMSLLNYRHRGYFRNTYDKYYF